LQKSITSEMVNDILRSSPVLLIRDGHRYHVDRIEYDTSKAESEDQITSVFHVRDTADLKPYGMPIVITTQFFKDLDQWHQHRTEMPGMAFVIEVTKNPDGSGSISWDVMGLSDPQDKRYM